MWKPCLSKWSLLKDFVVDFTIVNNICKILTFFTRYRETIQEQSGSDDDDECQEEERKPIEVDSDDSDWGYTWVLNVGKEKVVSRTDQYAALLWEFLYCLKEFQFLTVFNYAKKKNNISVYRCV